MMLLHNDINFRDIIVETSRCLGMQAAFVEKDYYVFMLLKLIRSKNDMIMFKGGTSLSKAWGILNRFSEDIDLNLLPEITSTEGNRRKFNHAIYDSYLDLGFNYDKSLMKSKLEYNSYKMGYNPIFRSSAIRDTLEVDAMANKKGKILNATYTVLPVSNFIWNALGQQYYIQLVAYGLEPFNIATQNLDVTFVEKILSLSNRYLRGESFRLSRHLYDIYCMWNYGNLSKFDLNMAVNETFKYLRERKNDKVLHCGKPVKTVLRELLDNDFYMEDYNNVTLGMILRDKVSYVDAKLCLYRILNMMYEF